MHNIYNEFLMNVRLVPMRPEDEDFVYRLYAGTRLEEIAALGWSEAQQQAFLRMQYMAQKRSYEMAYPGAQHSVILRDEQPVGRMIVLRSPHRLCLIDISLLAEHRGCGIGSALLGVLIAEARRIAVPLDLQVLKTNRAARLYERLGFTRSGEDDMYYQMRLHPG